MTSDDRLLSSCFETPRFSFEDFTARYFQKMLDASEEPIANYLRGLRGGEAEFLKSLFYVMAVTKIQHPGMDLPEMLYSLNYGMACYFLDEGQTPGVALEELSKVPWDFLPGLGDNGRETANAIAVRAFGDAIAVYPSTSRQ